MKILIINYRFFISGGPERYMFNLIELLKLNGHTIIPFSINYEKNEKTEYSEYFATPLSNRNEIYFKDQTFSFSSTIKTLSRSFYSHEVYKKLNKLIVDTKPDYAIVLHYLRKLSPSILSALNVNKVPFIVRLSDFAMICPNALLLNKNQYCDKCIKKGIWESVKDKCIQNSYSATLINYLAQNYHKKLGYYDLIKKFIIPSRFLYNKMIQAGYDENRLVYLPTFIEAKETYSNHKKKELTFVGRIEKLKGLHVFLNSLLKFSSLELENYKINIIGDGDKEYVNQMKIIGKKINSNVLFWGFKDKGFILEKLKHSLFSVVPSLVVDNLPNTLLESLSVGTPVIASNHGSFPDFIRKGYNGDLFEVGNVKDLSKSIDFFLSLTNEQMRVFEKNCFEYINQNHSSKEHYTGLMNVYSELLKL